MTTRITYRHMLNTEADEVFELVRAVFDEYVTSDLTDEGIGEFLRAAAQMIYDRPTGHFIFVAASIKGIVGMIDMRDNSHVCLFYVAKDFHRKGIGRNLFRLALEECTSAKGHGPQIDVNSSLFAVPAYEKLGFVKTKPAQLVNGIRFVPMQMTTTRG